MKCTFEILKKFILDFPNDKYLIIGFMAIDKQDALLKAYILGALFFALPHFLILGF
jgi:hypothetical protein